MNFKDYLEMMPSIYCYWTGILIAWSFVSSLGLLMIMKKIKERGFAPRQSDKASMIACLFGGITMLCLMFLFSDFTSKLLDTMIIVNLWYTLFIAYVSGSSLSGWPIVHFSPHIRDHQHRIQEDQN